MRLPLCPHRLTLHLGCMFAAAMAVAPLNAHTISQDNDAPTQHDGAPHSNNKQNENVESNRRSLSDAQLAERQSISQFLADQSWPDRAIAALRLQRYACDASALMIEHLLADSNWRVRCFAIHSLAIRGIKQRDAWFDNEQEPRVIRTLLRHGYTFDETRLARGFETLARSPNLSDRLLAAEIALASGNDSLAKQVDGLLNSIINRMSRTEAGAFSPRLAAITGAPDYRRPHHWRQWLLKFSKRTDLLEVARQRAAAIAPSNIASLSDDQFIALRDYINTLRPRTLDLAILLDCTDSMYSELADVQGGLDELMLFLSEVQSKVRIAIVAYRDRREEFETRAFDFSSDITRVREQLWRLSTEGGGDSPEAVFPAMSVALNNLSWLPEHDKIMIIIGDGPPHIGYGSACEQLAARANENARLVTHTIQTSGKPVKHFPEIAKAGGGRCVTLNERDSLLIEIAGLTVAEQFEDQMTAFFQLYFELCR